MELQKLIDHASSIAGSDYRLAKSIGVSRQAISDWKHGRKPCPIETRAELAGIAGFDALGEVVEAMLEKHRGTPKEERLRTLFNWRKR